jgi:hypothetical protein
MRETAASCGKFRFPVDENHVSQDLAFFATLWSQISANSMSKLQKLSAKTGAKPSELIRRAVDAYLKK